MPRDDGPVSVILLFPSLGGLCSVEPRNFTECLRGTCGLHYQYIYLGDECLLHFVLEIPFGVGSFMSVYVCYYRCARVLVGRRDRGPASLGRPH